MVFTCGQKDGKNVSTFLLHARPGDTKRRTIPRASAGTADSMQHTERGLSDMMTGFFVVGTENALYMLAFAKLRIR